VILSDVFRDEWEPLNPEQRRLVLEDFQLMMREDYDTPDPTMAEEIARENYAAGAAEYVRRIGRGNLLAYAKCLQAGARRREGGAS